MKPPSAATLAAAKAAGLELYYCPDLESWMAEAQCRALRAKAKAGDAAVRVKLGCCVGQGCPGIVARRGRALVARADTRPARKTLSAAEVGRRLGLSERRARHLLAEARESGELTALQRGRWGALYDTAEAEAWIAAQRAARDSGDTCTVQEFSAETGVPDWELYEAIRQSGLEHLNPGRKPRLYPRRGLSEAVSRRGRGAMAGAAASRRFGERPISPPRGETPAADATR